MPPAVTSRLALWGLGRALTTLLSLSAVAAAERNCDVDPIGEQWEIQGRKVRDGYGVAVFQFGCGGRLRAAELLPNRKCRRTVPEDNQSC
jgi:hypothetical protein